MATPPKGDFLGVPLNPAGRGAANAWDPVKDEADGDQCRAYGVGGLMRMPTRLHITWQDDDTLKIETDAGAQTRILNFKPSNSPGGDWRGLPGELGAASERDGSRARRSASGEVR